MDCNGYRENLTSYIDTELTTKENKLMLEHEADCSDCMQLKSEMQNILRTIKSFTKVETSANFEASLYEKLHLYSENSLPDKIKELFAQSPIGVKALAAAFAILIALVSGSYFLYNGTSISDDDGMPALSSPRYIENDDNGATDVIEEETAEESKEDEEADEKNDIEDSSKKEVIRE